MKKHKQLFFTFSLLLLVCIQTVYGQNLKELKLDNKLSVLNDKAFFNFPAAAVNSARAADIMSADYNKNLETRIVLDEDKMKLVFFAQELFLIGDKNLFDDVSKEESKLNFQKKLLSDKDQLLSILCTPTVFDTAADAILINRLIVKTQDNTVFQIDAYINPEGFKLKNDFTDLSKRVFETLSKGTRIIDKSAREESQKILGTKKDFKFSLPENYFITVDQKYDFQVFHVHKYRAYNDTGFVSITIYVGNHPSYFYKEYDIDINTAKKVTGKFLNENVDWLNFYYAEENLYIREQQIPKDNLEKGLILHVAMLSNIETSIADLSKIVEAIKVK
ncbi:MAG: hypothetical protein JWP12_2159 [Bacteroidetes bacterium]|nr:hypothetical protein [Bacteroidota bacterium]